MDQTIRDYLNSIDIRCGYDYIQRVGREENIPVKRARDYQDHVVGSVTKGRLILEDMSRISGSE